MIENPSAAYFATVDVMVRQAMEDLDCDEETAKQKVREWLLR